MFGLWRCMKRSRKRLLTLKPSANFITLHYSYIIGWTLIGSVILYGNGYIPYIDALFFASGAATQSGLNTIDVNNLALYQQVFQRPIPDPINQLMNKVSIMLIACVCNPIFINTTVVFVRLYWFEKRFQHIISEHRRKTQHSRRPVKHGQTTEHEQESGTSLHQTGVGNREIRILRGSRGHAYGGYIENEFAFNDGQDWTGNGIRPRRRSSLGDLDHPISNHIATSRPPKDDSHIDSEKQQERILTSGKLSADCVSRSLISAEDQESPEVRGTLRHPSRDNLDLEHDPCQIMNGDLALSQLSGTIDNEVRRSCSSTKDTPGHETENELHLLGRHVMIDVPKDQQGPAKFSAYKRSRTAETNLSGVPTGQLDNQSRSGTFASFVSGSAEPRAPVPYLSWTPTIGHNSNFVDLDEDQREELGGIEYRALKLLALILVCFYVGFHLMGMICLVPWINQTSYRTVTENAGVNSTWWGIFTAASLFNDLGFTLTPDSMISFQRAVFPLVLGIFLIVIGNTGFPCMLRFVIWTASKCVPKSSSVWEELRFLLDHPRRCFTLLFPSKANWVLFWILVLLNGIDLMFFIVLDLNDPTVTSIPPGFRLLAGLFQAASTRTAGFAVVNLPELHPAVQVSYMVMMYISVFPIAMSVRRSNVYEERSLGVWPSREAEDGQSSYLSNHVRRQLSFDLWFVFLGFFLIAIIEGSHLQARNEKDGYTLFAVLFEIVSAYGTVGLSQGFPGTNTSFSGKLRPLSKLVIIAMQVRGRHRGLPYGLDRAILLPSESLHMKENEDATRRAHYAHEMDDSLPRTASGLSRRSTNRSKSHVRNIFEPTHLKNTLAGAFRAGPPQQE